VRFAKNGLDDNPYVDPQCTWHKLALTEWLKIYVLHLYVAWQTLKNGGY